MFDGFFTTLLILTFEDYKNSKKEDLLVLKIGKTGNGEYQLGRLNTSVKEKCQNSDLGKTNRQQSSKNTASDLERQSPAQQSLRVAQEKATLTNRNCTRAVFQLLIQLYLTGAVLSWNTSLSCAKFNLHRIFRLLNTYIGSFIKTKAL